MEHFQIKWEQAHAVGFRVTGAGGQKGNLTKQKHVPTTTKRAVLWERFQIELGQAIPERIEFMYLLKGIFT